MDGPPDLLRGNSVPLSRIPRIELVAHNADMLLAIPFTYIGLQFFLKPKLLVLLR